MRQRELRKAHVCASAAAGALGACPHCKDGYRWFKAPKKGAKKGAAKGWKTKKNWHFPPGQFGGGL